MRLYEIPSQRTWNAKSWLESNGATTTEFHGKWLHYRAADGSWKDIDCNIKRVVDGFEVTEAPFYFKAPLTADGEVYFESNNRWDVFERKEIGDEPFGEWMKALDAAPVAGELFDIGSGGSHIGRIERSG